MSEERGFLTETDREFLTGEKEYTGKNAKQQRYHRREAIAARARQAFHDFALLNDVLDGRERDRIFGPDEHEADELLLALRETIAFLYRALEGDMDRQGALQHRRLSARFEHVLTKGVYRGEMARRRAADKDGKVRGFPSVEFDVSFRTPEFARWDEAAEELAENYGRGLGNEELRDLLVTAAMNTANASGRDGEHIREQARGPALEDLAERVAEAAREGESDAIAYSVLDEENDGKE